ncbi:MAG TPA: cytochrome o ubiquinol oxidase subunit III [Candidatus Saccharimonadales bacterium]|nr:cytochrome o ubiquinol oxidase subunit III [Candidatus Saccharimonadales bacterium]
MAAPESTNQLAGAQADDRSLFGFWLYLMTDCILFATLFATFVVMRDNTAGGPAGNTLFNLPYVLAETLLLLTSSFTAGLSMIAVQRQRKRQVLGWLAVTFALGAAFLIMELLEFHHLAADGNSWRRSGFLSAYFTLVGTHGLHITFGLLWMGVLAWKLRTQALSQNVVRRLTMLNMFWHFLDIVWIFIFSIVYMIGAL